MRKSYLSWTNNCINSATTSAGTLENNCDSDCSDSEDDEEEDDPKLKECDIEPEQLPMRSITANIANFNYTYKYVYYPDPPLSYATGKAVVGKALGFNAQPTNAAYRSDTLRRYDTCIEQLRAGIVGKREDVSKEEESLATYERDLPMKMREYEELE